MGLHSYSYRWWWTVSSDWTRFTFPTEYSFPKELLSISSAVSVQRSSWRMPRSVDVLRLAKKNRTSKQGMAEIFKQFGDHQYAWATENCFYYWSRWVSFPGEMNTKQQRISIVRPSVFSNRPTWSKRSVAVRDACDDGCISISSLFSFSTLNISIISLDTWKSCIERNWPMSIIPPCYWTVTRNIPIGSIAWLNSLV